MRFYTREWHDGSLSDEDVEAAQTAWLAEVKRLSPSLPAGVRLLVEAGGTYSLHDGRFAEVALDDLALSMRIDGFYWAGDSRPTGSPSHLPCGFQIAYYEPKILDITAAEFLQTTVDPEVEILYCEFDVRPDGSFEHRMLLWPPRLGEIGIAFRDANVTVELLE